MRDPTITVPCGACGVETSSPESICWRCDGMEAGFLPPDENCQDYLAKLRVATNILTARHISDLSLDDLDDIRDTIINLERLVMSVDARIADRGI